MEEGGWHQKLLFPLLCAYGAAMCDTAPVQRSTRKTVAADEGGSARIVRAGKEQKAKKSRNVALPSPP